jgi:sugar lactone lactonase YvrE
MAIDSEDCLYVTSRIGTQVLSKTGQHLGVIVTPKVAANVACSGPDKDYVAARQELYRMRMLARGVARPGK